MAGSGAAHLRPDDHDVVLRAEHLVVEYKSDRGVLQALGDVSIDVCKGETLGIVGESGCGKSTLARALMQLPRPTRGSVHLAGRPLSELRGRPLRRARQPLQMVFQDPISSLNPLRSVRRTLDESLRVQATAGTGRQNRRRRIRDVLEAVGLDPDAVSERRPTSFSGGQAQRVSIARALIGDPDVIICDEPVSALDVSVQAQILNLLEATKNRFGLTLVFISHDLAVIKNVSDRLVVMYLGKICEVGDPDSVFRNPRHPYTAGLLAAVPDTEETPGAPPDTELRGEVPSPLNPPSRCRFRTRCPNAGPRCTDEEPVIRPMGPDHYAACHFPLPPVRASSC
jgi:peptide/nickel transport system ATP-binding protein